MFTRLLSLPASLLPTATVLPPMSVIVFPPTRKVSKNCYNGCSLATADIRQLRDLMRYRSKLANFKSSEKNRLQNCLTVSNIQLGNVVSDTIGKSAQAILDRLLENPEDTSFDLEPLTYKSLTKKTPEFYDAIDGCITPEQTGKLKIIKHHFEDLGYPESRAGRAYFCARRSLSAEN